MKRKQYLLILIFLSIMVVFLPSCDEESRPTFPLSAEIFYSIVGKQVAFTALTHSAVNWSWDFGDGNTSNEKNPVHVYEEGGYYLVILTTTDAKGNSLIKEARLAVELTPYAMLTGDHTADDYDGKKWKISAAHPAGGDYFANADADLTTIDPSITPLPTGALDLYLGYGEVYKDEYIFYHDGRYRMDLKEDGAALSGLVYQMVTSGGSDIVKKSKMGEEFGLCIARHNPGLDATFTFIVKEDFSVPSVYGAQGVVTYKNVSTLDFSGSEFIGFKDFQKKVIVKSITDTKMQLVLFMAASPKHLPMNTHALILSFEIVN